MVDKAREWANSSRSRTRRVVGRIGNESMGGFRLHSSSRLYVVSLLGYVADMFSALSGSQLSDASRRHEAPAVGQCDRRRRISSPKSPARPPVSW